MLCHVCHAIELPGRQNGNSQCTGFLQLAAGILAADQVVRLFADRGTRLGTQRCNELVDAVPGVRLHLAGDHDGLPQEGILGDLLSLLRHGLDVYQLLHLEPHTVVVLVPEPFIDVLVLDLPEIRKLGEVILRINGIREGIQAPAEHLSQSLACGAADHGNVHGDQKPLKGGLPAPLDGIPKAAPGGFPKALHGDDLRPVGIQPVEVHVAVEPAPAKELFQGLLPQLLNVHGLLADKVDKPLEVPQIAVGIVTVEGFDHAAILVRLGFLDAGGGTTAGTHRRNHSRPVKMLPVQIALHMGDDLIPFADQDAASKNNEYTSIKVTQSIEFIGRICYIIQKENYL